MNKKKPLILVAEDYVINQEITKEMLEMLDCEVDIAENGLETLRMHEEKAYDLIFMDIQMPELDGYDTTKKIREKEKQNHKHIPIVALTANAFPEDRVKCLEAGMDDYISKPIKLKDLQVALEKNLSH